MRGYIDHRSSNNKEHERFRWIYESFTQTIGPKGLFKEKANSWNNIKNLQQFYTTHSRNLGSKISQMLPCDNRSSHPKSLCKEGEDTETEGESCRDTSAQIDYNKLIYVW